MASTQPVVVAAAAPAAVDASADGKKKDSKKKGEKGKGKRKRHMSILDNLGKLPKSVIVRLTKLYGIERLDKKSQIRLRNELEWFFSRLLTLIDKVATADKGRNMLKVKDLVKVMKQEYPMLRKLIGPNPNYRGPTLNHPVPVKSVMVAKAKRSRPATKVAAAAAAAASAAAAAVTANVAAAGAVEAAANAPVAVAAPAVEVPIAAVQKA